MPEKSPQKPVSHLHRSPITGITPLDGLVYGGFATLTAAAALGTVTHDPSPPERPAPQVAEPAEEFDAHDSLAPGEVKVTATYHESTAWQIADRLVGPEVEIRPIVD